MDVSWINGCVRERDCLSDAWAIQFSVVEGGGSDTCAREGRAKVGALLPAVA